MKSQKQSKASAAAGRAGSDPSAAAERPIEELFLLHLRYKEAEMVETGSNRPILLDDPSQCWVVYTGWADCFAVSLDDGRVEGSRRHLFRVEAGQAAFGLDLAAADGKTGLLLVGSRDTRLLRLSTGQIYRLAQDHEFAMPITALIDGWVHQLSTCTLDGLPPKECRRLEPGPSVTVGARASVCARKGVLWVRHDSGHSRFAGKESDLPLLNGHLRWPISDRSWIETVEPSQINLIDTPTFLSSAAPWPDLHEFHRSMLRTIAWEMGEIRSQEGRRLRQKADGDREIVRSALSRLAAPLLAARAAVPTEGDDEPLLLQACRLIGEKMGMTIVSPAVDGPTGEMTLSEIARASHFQTRRVVLKGDWWREDNGLLLGFWAESGRPLVLQPHRRGYRLIDPAGGASQRVTAEVAEMVKPFAHMFYRPLPNKPIGAWELIKFGLAGDLSDLRRILLAGMGGGLLGIAVPIATGLIFDRVIPFGEQLPILQIGAALIAVVLAMCLLQVVQNLAFMRLEERMGAELEAAIWQRVLNLPVSFFRQYTSGDLGHRVMGIRRIQQILSGTVMNAVLAGLFSVFSWLLLFYYHSGLAWTATALVSVSVGVMIFAGYRQMAPSRRLAALQGRISGIVLQAVEGISKFRASATEGRAFATWAAEFSQAKQANYEVRNIGNNLQTFNAGYQVLMTLVIFAVIVLSGQQALTLGEFLAFNTAFVQFVGSVMLLSGAFLATLTIVPVYERARPILQAEPEIDMQKEHPGELKGGIEVSNVSFSYGPDMPLILKNISLEIQPGEYVALVGGSGSGKSTLFRLLLGFEQPQTGSVYFDGHDLENLDVREVRRQIGVVLQSSKVSAGDIYTNIVGSLPLTVDDAWEAAEMAGVAADIKRMPMGMHTVLSHGGGTISGGQRQRILIARAVVNKPRILFFDEATSALDNHTQAVVSQSLADLQATRVVIAHRLSTIRAADRILVLQNGSIVQQGSYDELIEVEGPFADLARRQMA